MDDVVFIKVKEAISQWIKDNEKKLAMHKIATEIVKNDKEGLFVILHFRKCMAAIVVSEPDHSPYHFVSFEAVAMKKGGQKMIHAWYDNDNITIGDIIIELEKAIDTVLEYDNSDGKHLS